MSSPGLLALVLLNSALLPAAAPLTLTSDKIRVSVAADSDYRELVQIRDGSKWLDALDSKEPTVRLQKSGGDCRVQSASLENDRIVTKGICAEGEFVRELTLGASDPGLISVAVRFTPKPGALFRSVEDQLTFSPKPRTTDTPLEGPLDFVWSQNIKANEQQLSSHWTFKSPVAMFQQGRVFAAIVPRVDRLTAKRIRAAPVALDLSVTPGGRAWFSYGAVSSKPVGHSYFMRTDQPLEGSAPIEFQYWIMASAQPERLGYRSATELLWRKFGSPALKQSLDLQKNVARPELLLFDDWRHEAWTRFAGETYFEFDCGGVRCGALASNRDPALAGRAPMEDAWFNAWFQTLRTAYGWHLYAQRVNDPEMRRRAEQTLNLALASPQHEGVFPTIYLHDSKTWIREDGWAGFRNDYHTFCMSWTGYWMLRWANDLVPQRKAEVLKYLRPYAEFLLRAQQQSGNIPSWFAEDLKPRDEYRDFNAETAGSALFLVELFATTSDRMYLDASLRAAAFVSREVVPRQRWFDFETFKSCARKPFDFYDRWTTQYPQNNLSTIQAAMLYLRLHQLTKQPALLETGRQVVDYLLLTQQVWNHPLFSPKLVGGMTTQNTDAEWSDARQCYVATLLLDYYQATQQPEYLERAVAAADSGFAVAPSENWAHTGFLDRPGALSPIHWGTGSQMASVEMMSALLGDAYVNVAGGHAVGFNASTIDRLKIAGKTIAFDLKTAQPGQRVLVRFAGLDTGASYTVVINGRQSPPREGRRLLADGFEHSP